MEEVKGQLIKRARQELGWTQDRLAEFLGVSKSIVGKWERGLRNPPASHLTQVILVHHLRPAQSDCADPESFRRFLALSLSSLTRQ